MGIWRRLRDVYEEQMDENHTAVLAGICTLAGVAVAIGIGYLTDDQTFGAISGALITFGGLAIALILSKKDKRDIIESQKNLIGELKGEVEKNTAKLDTIE